MKKEASMESNIPENDTDLSLPMSNLGDSNRSGSDLVISMKEGNEKEERRSSNEVPIATPASLYDNPNANLRSRFKGAPLPPPLSKSNDNTTTSNCFISPATPMVPPVAISSMIGVGASPPSAQSQENRTLAAMYQSSRRSRNNTPRPSGAAKATAKRFPPPPPLFSALSTDSGHPGPDAASPQRTGDSNEVTVGADTHKISLQSSQYLYDSMNTSWNTSFGSLMNSSFMNSSLSNVQNFPRSRGPSINAAATHCPPSQPSTGEKSRQPCRLRANLLDYRIEDNDASRRMSDDSHSASSLLAPTDEKSTRRFQQQRSSDSMIEGNEDANSPSVAGFSVRTSSGNDSQSPEPSSICIHRFSALQVRSREEFEQQRRGSLDAVQGGKSDKAHYGDKRDVNGPSENVEGGNERNEPPKKKNKMRSSNMQYEDDLTTPQTIKTCMSSASFDIIAHEPSSRVSSIYDHDVSAPVNDVIGEELLNRDVNVNELNEINAEEDRVIGMLQRKVKDSQQQVRRAVPPDPPEANAPQDQASRVVPKLKGSQRARQETPSEKDQRILRRKIQRLLLIRHCSTCPIPPRPLATATTLEGRGSMVLDEPTKSRWINVCPVTSHCSEGKALCAHIRTCKLEDCKYKKCLTSREVLGHHKNCRDVACKICGPVRALNSQRRRRKSDSSIETIDDEGWLNANIVETDHNIICSSMPMINSPEGRLS
mmetsp:Transcript_13111/g.22473  ORF Transcript_13111/g.22473 Transcript_13111/m.22473 type:complete len:710 (-) Transcript_13111:204-2333(-)|eukprot:CAMPEP_0183712812 /NCGR_PEP_ID=MMETSP0737-20130205/7874_1 /TAXON_ID=385413 /ORGANISM="Thalassiosira miniscula, Strain CCMP1093" /LENGTH=709 /DNA_ID=CAMNT_0025941519 /DNA_START=497 /DNA_END=2626 /DNA_ORIENTATION=+